MAKTDNPDAPDTIEATEPTESEATEIVEQTEQVTEPVDTEAVVDDNVSAEEGIERKQFSRERFEALQHYVYKKIAGIQFGVFSPKMIKKMAAAKVVTPELYDKEGYPVDGGLMDLRLGTIDPGLTCKTDGQRLKESLGHFGYIELARPVMHIKFTGLIHLMLRCTCRETGKLIIPPEKRARAKKHLDNIEHEEGVNARRTALRAMVESSKKSWPVKQKKVVLEKPTTFVEGDKRLSPIEVRARLEKISDEDVEMFGFDPSLCRPEWMVLTVLPIPPVTMRPSITLESGERSEDDLTHKMGDIVRINQRLFENINAGAPEIIIEDLWDLLQYHVSTFFDNNVAQLPPARHRSGQPLKTVTERIKSKEGRIRHNLAGKRTNFCARTVISPDPMISLNEVGVPDSVAKRLTVPETVNDWNMDYLKKFVENGPDVYPGSNYVVRPDGKKKKITEETKEAALEELQPGYVVERHLLDGDIAIFNRQPSLHRMSMMCHKVRVLPGKTLRLNPAVCNPYNADFDGDEMNLHIPQTEESRAEAEILMQVQTQLISPRYGLSVIGCIQDAISGNYLLSRHGKFDRESAIQLLATIGVKDFKKLPRKKVLSGHDLFSVLLPDDFNFEHVSRNGEKVIVNDGVLTEGTIDTKTVGGEGEGLLLRALHKKYGAARTVDILHKILRLGAEYLLVRGFTTTIADEDVAPEARAEIDKLLNDAQDDVYDLIKQFNEGVLEILPGRSIEDTLELKILERLNKARNGCGTVLKRYVNDNNHAAVMILSGARGSITSIIQMSACVGQQALRGGRIDKGFSNRTLSCFKEGDLSPEARGFVNRGFKQGLRPTELFFHVITGRDALMDTALRTPKSGYLYRRLANALQDLRVEYDGTVRDAHGRVIQFMYGEDCVDVARSEGGKIDVQKIINSV